LLSGTVLSGELVSVQADSPVIGVDLNDGTAAKIGHYLRHVVAKSTHWRPDGSQALAAPSYTGVAALTQVVGFTCTVSILTLAVVEPVKILCSGGQKNQNVTLTSSRPSTEDWPTTPSARPSTPSCATTCSSSTYADTATMRDAGRMRWECRILADSGSA
jgi:hypothetical protein